MEDIRKRKPQRFDEWKYSDTGMYFVTVICKNRRHMLGRVVALPDNADNPVRDGVLDVPKLETYTCGKIVVELSSIGKIVENKLNEMNEKFVGVSIERYVIMPNHVHLLLFVENSVGTSRTPSLTDNSSTRAVRTNETIPRFISYLKRSTNKISGVEIWHRSYHDHIIRDYQDYLVRYKYLDNNPARWCEDEYYVPGGDDK